MTNIRELEKKAAMIRMDLLRMIYGAKTGHTGGSLSCTDILVALHYGFMKIDPQNPKWEERDRFIMSKGHSVEAYYSVLADLGFFPKEELAEFSRFNSRLIGHPNRKVPGVEMNTGALGHGLSLAVGMALAAKMDSRPIRVVTLMGDGEMAEGSVWEAAMAGGNYRLDNLIAIVDRNRLQISGNTENVMKLDSLRDKWSAFGWEVLEIDGNDMGQLLKTFEKLEGMHEKPVFIIANTTKGKGVSFMENVAKWHHGVPSKEQLEQALSELQKQLEEVSE